MNSIYVVFVNEYPVACFGVFESAMQSAQLYATKTTDQAKVVEMHSAGECIRSPLRKECDRLKAELAAAREELHGISCRHESSIRLMRNQNEELIKMLAKRPPPTLLVDKSDSAELAKLRALCIKTADLVANDGYVGLAITLRAAGRGEG
jgi:hypothetical protein